MERTDIVTQRAEAFLKQLPGIDYVVTLGGLNVITGVWNRELRIQKEFLVTILRDAVRLARIRYGGGVSSYLEVLDTETRLFDAELSRVLAAAGERVVVVQLYKALGGGWQVGSPVDGTVPAALTTH